MMRRAARCWVFVGAAGLGLMGCGGAAPATPAAQTPEPAAIAQVGASAVPPPPAPVSSTAPKASASPFHVIGELATELELYSAGDRGFLISPAGIELQLVGDEIVQDPLFKRGLPADFLWISVTSVAGRYPDSLWLSTSQASGRSGFSTLWSWDGKGWRKKQAFREGFFTLSIEPWTGGRMLALEVAGMAFDARFHVLAGDARIATPQFQKAKPSDLSFCKTHLNPSQFRALPSGEVIVAGQHCDPAQDYQELAVERWAPGAQQSTIEILPGLHAADDLPSVSYSATGLAVLSPTDIFLSGSKDTWGPDTKTITTPYFAHFDGTRWQALPSPIPNGVRALWTEPGGVLFATSLQDELWSRSTTGSWASWPWPAQVLEAGEVRVLGLWPHAPGDTWAVVEAVERKVAPKAGRPADPTRRRFLLRTRPATNPLPTLEAMDRKERLLHLPGPPVAWCTTRFVLLYTLGRQAPPDYDYPATRKALQGHREFATPEIEFVEFEREGRRYFGARVPDFEVGEKLAKLVKDKVPGATPELVCHNPIETRKLQMDLAPSTTAK